MPFFWAALFFQERKVSTFFSDKKSARWAPLKKIGERERQTRSFCALFALFQSVFPSNISCQSSFPVELIKTRITTNCYHSINYLQFIRNLQDWIYKTYSLRFSVICNKYPGFDIIGWIQRPYFGILKLLFIWQIANLCVIKIWLNLSNTFYWKISKSAQKSAALCWWALEQVYSFHWQARAVARAEARWFFRQRARLRSRNWRASSGNN